MLNLFPIVGGRKNSIKGWVVGVGFGGMGGSFNCLLMTEVPEGHQSLVWGLLV